MFDVFCFVFCCVVASLQDWIEARSKKIQTRKNVNNKTAGGNEKGQGENQLKEDTIRDGVAQGVEPREATSQPPTEVPSQIGIDEGESAEVMAPLVRKRRRLVKFEEASPTNEAPRAEGVMGSGVLVVTLKQ